jgi:hypothetical protein
MNTEICIKYLDYVSHECERHLSDGQVTDDELINLIIEFQRFQEKVVKSELSEEIKTKIADIKLNSTIKGVERGNRYLIIALLTFGSWAILISMRKQSKRKQTLNDLKFDTSRLFSFLRLNY